MKRNLFSIAAFTLPSRSHSHWKHLILSIKSTLVSCLKTLRLFHISRVFPSLIPKMAFGWTGKLCILMALGEGHFIHCVTLTASTALELACLVTVSRALVSTDMWLFPFGLWMSSWQLIWASWILPLSLVVTSSLWPFCQTPGLI